MNKNQTVLAKKWMQTHLEEYRDECNEINCTKMTEDCTDALSLYKNDNFDIPEELFDLAVDIK